MRYTWMLAALLLAGCDEEQQSSSPPASAPFDKPSTYSNTSVGPIIVELDAPARVKIERVLWIEFQSDTAGTAEVSASFRLGISGEGHIVSARLFRASSAGMELSADGIVRTNNVYESHELAASFSQAAGTYEIGLAVEITGDEIQNVDAIFRDVTVTIR